MDKIIEKLFSGYLSEQNTANNTDYSKVAKKALAKEKELRNLLNAEQTTCFEELFEFISQLHYFEVKDAFYNACKLGAKASKEFVI